jgi:FMN phosphatase YigB (HAD superfamily)
MEEGARTTARMPQAVTFDLWFTLIYQTTRERREYEAARRSAWEWACGSPALRTPLAEAFLSRHGREVERRDGEGRAWPLAEQAQWAGRLLRRPVDAGRLERAMSRALASSSVRVAPGAVEMLERLAALGIRTAIVSNIVHEPPYAVRRCLSELRLSPRTNAIVLSAEVGSAKPSPGPLLRALRELDCPSERAMHIGDLPADRMAAWSAGIAAVQFTGLGRWRPVRERREIRGSRRRIPTIGRWAELPERLPGLFRRATASRPDPPSRAGK